jgi:TetR/AcrR family transcriptional regulator, transcriptional repressor for nem operon
MILDDSEVYWWQPLAGDENPDTRAKILLAAYKEIHLKGFQAASLNNILAHTGVTKGALYHHFPNKTELGYAVIDEVIGRHIQQNFIAPLIGAENPVQTLIDLIEASGQVFTMKDISLGCPLGNLAQEMAPIDEGFRVRLDRIYQSWMDALSDSLSIAQQKKLILDDIDTRQVAALVVAAMEGCLSAGKISQDINRLYCCGSGLIQYLKLLQKTEE